MFNDNIGKILLDDVKKNNLKPFNHAVVSSIIKENDDLEKQINKIKEVASNTQISEEISINYILLKYYRDRNIRIFKTYLYRRLVLIDEINEMLSEKEKEIFLKIKEIQDNYFLSFKLLDINAFEPPTSSYIHIYTIEDCGVIFDDTMLELVKNRIYFVKKKSVEHLLDKGCINIL